MSSSQEKPMNAELRLFPAPPKKRSPSKKRNLDSARSPLEERAVSPAPLQVEDERQSAMGGRETPQSQYPTQSTSQQVQPQIQIQTQAQPQTRNQNLLGQFQFQAQSPPQPQYTRTASPLAVPPPAELPRSHTSFSEAPTLVRSNSMASTAHYNSSPPREKREHRERQTDEPVMRSIFPRYNPELPLEHQRYYPTQASTPSNTTIPRAIVNRRPYSPGLTESSPSGFRSPMAIGLSPGLFPQGLHDESVLEPSTNDEMKELWKVTNGWRVSASEGRRFCLRMTSALEEPVHTFSSTTGPFYTLRLDPTSASAIVTLTRQDPNKSKSSTSPKLLSTSSSSSKSNTGIEVLTTTLEAQSRRLPPGDGLVALLYPRAASNMAIELATKAARREGSNPLADGDMVVQAAERECGRLVFDSDAGKYYLVHPSMPTPFYISIHSSPAWSRSEYTLEHPELPRNLIRLVRDGAGSGYLEIDTAVAAKIDCFYIVDVAVTAILIVAVAEEKNISAERFEAPPPSIAPDSPRISLNNQLGAGGRKAKKRDVKIEEMEIDLESQDSLKNGLAGRKRKEKKEKVPGCCGLLWMLIKFFVWLFGLFFRAIGKVSMFICRGCRTKRGEKL